MVGHHVLLGVGGQLNTMDSFVKIAAQSFPMGLDEGLSAWSRGAPNDLCILAGAVADKGSEAVKDDLSAVLRGDHARVRVARPLPRA